MKYCMCCGCALFPEMVHQFVDARGKLILPLCLICWQKLERWTADLCGPATHDRVELPVHLL
jgi:hypothetical protein